MKILEFVMNISVKGTSIVIKLLWQELVDLFDVYTKIN